ncbi:MAG: hypothetical protein OXH52_16930 [Gammaproteobacteria bacterium]|nr:hypothetical protein [Gammaproteobacteria bacterium]
MFSAGSVVEHVTPLHDNELYISRAMRDIESIMLDRVGQLDDALFLEYWGESCEPNKRLKRWLELADKYATDWTPSAALFSGSFNQPGQ